MWSIRGIQFYAPHWQELKRVVTKNIDARDIVFGKRNLIDNGNEVRDLEFTTYTTTHSSKVALEEISSNRKYNPVWLQDNTYDGQFNGWYYINSFQDMYATTASGDIGFFRFNMSLKFMAGDDKRLATYASYSTTTNSWDITASPIYTTPQGVSNISPDFVRIIFTSDGSYIHVTNEVNGNIVTYKNPSDKSTLFLSSECKIFDTNNNESESGWTRVYDTQHRFTGKIAFDNSAWRCVIFSDYIQVKTYDSTWVDLVKIKIKPDGSKSYIDYWEVISLSPDEVLVVVAFFDNGFVTNLRMKMTRGISCIDCNIHNNSSQGVNGEDILFYDFQGGDGIWFNYDKAVDQSIISTNTSLPASSNNSFACLIGKNPATSYILGHTYQDDSSYMPESVSTVISGCALGRDIQSNSHLYHKIWGLDSYSKASYEYYKIVEVEGYNVVGTDTVDTTCSGGSRVRWTGASSFTAILDTSVAGLSVGTYRIYLRYKCSSTSGQVRAKTYSTTTTSVTPSSTNWVFEPIGDVNIYGSWDNIQIEANGSYTWDFDEILIVPVTNDFKNGVYDRNKDALKYGTQETCVVRAGYLPR